MFRLSASDFGWKRSAWYTKVHNETSKKRSWVINKLASACFSFVMLLFYSSTASEKARRLFSLRAFTSTTAWTRFWIISRLRAEWRIFRYIHQPRRGDKFNMKSIDQSLLLNSSFNLSLLFSFRSRRQCLCSKENIIVCLSSSNRHFLKQMSFWASPNSTQFITQKLPHKAFHPREFEQFLFPLAW